jgi:metal-dependent amidase/aminoacylase/carboxypeptidase family protein
VNRAREICIALFGDEAGVDMPFRTMGAKDFSCVLQKVPGAMLLLGVGGEIPDRPLDSYRFILDESVLADGVPCSAGSASGVADHVGND